MLGCGGNMTAETYVAHYRQYAANLRTFNGHPTRLIAVGADTDDYEWTEKVMAGAMKWRPNPTPLLTHHRQAADVGAVAAFLYFCGQ
jgi:alpha-N-arabinofuranosidase